MDAIFLKLFNLSITACYIIIAILIIRLAFKKVPKWVHCMLWGIAGIRLIIPFSIKSMFSLVPRSETISAEYLGTGSIASENVSTINIATPLTNGAANLDTAWDIQKFIHIGSIIWLIGMAGLLIYGIVVYIRLRHRVANSNEIYPNVYLSKAITSPFILGIFKPRIYLPFDIERDNIPHVLAHERAHIKRRDHLIKPLSFLVLTVYWFNPVIWLAYILLCRDIEHACDEAVIKKYGESQKKPYSKALLECSIDRKSIAACPLAFGEINLKGRIKNVLSYKKPALWIIIAAVVISIVLAVVFLTNPKDEPDVDFPIGTYSFDEVIYMNGLSSYYPFEDTGEIYTLSEDSVTITNKAPSILDSDIPIEKLKSSSFSNEEWTELFIFDFGVPDVSSINKDNRTMWILSDEYRVYLMNQEVWLMRLAGTNGVWSIYKLKPYDASVTADEGPVIDFWDPMTNMDSEDSLDKVIPHAIYTVNQMNFTEADIATQAYTVLRKEDKEDELVLYVMAMYMEFYIHDGRLLEAGGSHLPVVITLEKGDNGGYGMKEYWEPADGSGYMESIKREFPDDFNELLLNTQLYAKAHIQTCYESAVLQSGVDVDARIKRLIEILCMSPAQASNPYTYIQEHETEYRELIYYGKNTLQYCFDLFYEGGQTGLEGYLMALVCSEILGIEPSGEGLGYTTGQQWYDEFISSMPDIVFQ